MLLCFSVAAIAGSNHKFPPDKKELRFDRDFQSISIEGDITVILTNEPSGTIVLEGEKKHLNKVRYTLKNNLLSIDVNQVTGYKKLTVYLSAIALNDMRLHGNADISSIDILKSEQLHLTLNGNISVKIRTTGKLSVDAPDEIELIRKSRSIEKGKPF